ncbi:MAG TPA: biotin/lipoyl-containing protein, partial [Bordetella sp.]|nr:biotin/lipoyl-containing protein [Bordetella sp.]
MGIHIIKMPDIGEGIAEVELVGWHVNVGDTVAEDQPLADVMTDKATVEIPSPVVGKIVALGGSVGDVMAVGSELIRLEVEGAGNARADAPPARAGQEAASGQATPAAPAAKPAAPEPVPQPASQPAPRQAGPAAAGTGIQPPAPAAPVRQPGERPLASPAVRKRAWDMGIELRFVHGSGPAGRILHEDLDAHAHGQGAAAPAARSGYGERHDEQQVPV